MKDYKMDLNDPELEAFLDKKVVKVSGKPFKSGLKVATVEFIVWNPMTGKPAFSFYEDNSVVDYFQVKLLDHPSS